MDKNRSLFEKGKNFFVSTDTNGWMQQTFTTPTRADGCFFILCTKGECTFHIHEKSHRVKTNNLLCIMPRTYFQVIDRTPDCELRIMGFSNHIIDTTTFITTSMGYISSLIEQPAVALQPDWMELYIEHYNLLEKTTHATNFHLLPDVANHLLLSILTGLIHLHQQSQLPTSPAGSRAEEIIRLLIEQVMVHYVEHRNVAFYAKQLKLTAQHLSTTVKRVTGLTTMDIIARFVIHDAQEKLRNSSMTVLEISNSLHFPDVSFFGKYFKRYTGVSPKTYRENERRVPVTSSIASSCSDISR
jgi:AraC-like DNA-binding protein